MVTPYQSYFQMLLPLVPVSDTTPSSTSNEQFSAESSEEELTTEIIVKICFDNARPLTDQASMTMRSRQKQKPTKICRWSSVPDLSDASSLSAENNSSARRSSEDLRSLRTQNSKKPRSSDNLRVLSTGSLTRSSPKKEGAVRRNDHWDLSSSSSSTKMSPKSQHNRNSKLKNPFDLTMSGLALPPANAHNTMPVPAPDMAQSLRVPQRKRSMDLAPQSALKTLMNRLETTKDESCEETSSASSPGCLRIAKT